MVEGGALCRSTAVAVEDRGERVTYAELMARADRVARALTSRGLKKGDVVAVRMVRSSALIAVVLGLQKAGLVYLPILPTLPQERFHYILEDAASKLLVEDAGQCSETLVQSVGAYELLDGETLGMSDVVLPRIGGSDISYVAYTSGTTGKPKGVQITQAGICNRIAWMADFYSFGHDDAILCKCPIDFDPSLFEIFMPLVGGGRIVIFPNDVQLSASAVIEAIDRHRVTFLNLVPIVLRQMLLQAQPHQCTSLRHIVCGGEAWEGALIEKTHQRFPAADLYNGYGPTETSIGVTIWKSDRRTIQSAPPIGQPIQNVHVLIVDEEGQPVADGREGELWIGGVAVSPGYLGGIEQNKQFVQVSFDTGESMRFYKTGDLVQRRADGQIMFAGRRDQQVKINGVRVELEEIEAVALSVSGVNAAGAVMDRLGGIAFVSLYFTTDSEDPKLVDELRAQLRGRLKPQVMPQRLQRIEALPTKGNGKIDRGALATVAGAQA